MKEQWHTIPEEYEPCAEVKLWKAVLELLIRDAFSRSVDPKEQLNRYKARNWLKLTNRNFRLVCEFAGYCPRFIYENITTQYNNEEC